MIYKRATDFEVPALGLGTFELTGPAGEDAVARAIDIGYRHIDTAVRYGNEAEIGRAIRRSGIPRSDFFLTTKVPFARLAPDEIGRCVAESLDRLQTDRVELLLLHWPPRDQPLDGLLDALAHARDCGRARLIGVSNFTTRLLGDALARQDVGVAVNQVEYHPFLRQDALLASMRTAGMLLVAYLPLAQGAVFRSSLLQDIGRRHGKSAGQVALRWLVQQPGVAAIPRSSKPENMRANFDIFDFELSAEEMSGIQGLARGLRLINPPFAPTWDPD